MLLFSCLALLHAAFLFVCMGDLERGPEGLLEYTTIHYNTLRLSFYFYFFVTTYALVIKRSANKNDTIKKAHWGPHILSPRINNDSIYALVIYPLRMHYAPA